MQGRRALLAAAVLSALWATAPAHAVPITDFVNPADTSIILGSTPTPCPAGFTCGTSFLSFVHDITDDGFSVGDTITSATVAIHLTDDNGSEDYTYLIGVGQTESASNVPTNSTDTYTLSVGSLADLQDDGKIDIKITITSANNNLSINFADSTLTAQVTPQGRVGTTDVPAPATPLLLATGLTMFGWRFRRRG